jgi:hypothetical protein
MRFLLPRFKLASLLIAVALAAIVCATIWQFWPRFRAYQARMRFERAASQFRPGMSVDDISAMVGPAEWNSYSADANGDVVALTPYFFEGAWYCVYMHLDTEAGKRFSSQMPSMSSKTYRLAVPPKVYTPQTQAAKDQVNPPETVRTTQWTPEGEIDVRAPPLVGEDARRAAYVQDFYEHIAGRTKADLGIHYEELPQAK